jgi:hypothetical protein
VAGEADVEGLVAVAACCPSAVAPACGAVGAGVEEAVALCASVVVSNGIAEASSAVAAGAGVLTGALSKRLFVLCLAAP